MEKKQKSKEFKIESEKSLYNSAKIIVFIATFVGTCVYIEIFFRDFSNTVLLIVVSLSLILIAILCSFVVAAILKVSLRLKSIEELLRETANDAKRANSAAEEEKS